MSEHTKLPWAYKSNGSYFDIGVPSDSINLPIYPSACIGVSHEQEENAKLIVKAVNYHDRLVEALRDCEEVLSYVAKKSGLTHSDAEAVALHAHDLLTELEQQP